jgi:hypothetical protein
VIKGAGMFTVKTSDVAKALGDPSAGEAGWGAFARFDQGATEINGYAIYEKENVACLFEKLMFPGGEEFHSLAMGNEVLVEISMLNGQM